MSKLDLIKERYNVESTDELTESQLWECANSEDFADWFSIQRLKQGVNGETPKKDDVINAIKAAINKDLRLQITYTDGEDLPLDIQESIVGFSYLGINEDYEPFDLGLKPLI